MAEISNTPEPINNIESPDQNQDFLAGFKSSLEQKVTDPQLLVIAEEEFTQGYESAQDKEAFIKDILRTFRTIEKKILSVDKDGREEFLNYLQKSPQRDIVLNLIETANPRKLKKYTKKNGFVINDETLALFHNKFWDGELKLNQERVNTKEVTVETGINGLSNLKRSFQSIDISTLQPKFRDKINIIKNISENEAIDNSLVLDNILKELVSAFEEGNQEDAKDFITLLGLLKNDNPESFDTFKGVIMSSGREDLKIILNDFLNTPESPVLPKPLEVTQRAIQEAGVNRYADIPGQVVELDTSKIPPLRSFSLEGSDYKMESDLWMGVFYDAMLTYERERKPLLASEKELKWQLSHIWDTYSQNNLRIEELKELLQTQTDLDILDPEVQAEMDTLLAKQEKLNGEHNELKLQYDQIQENLTNIHKEYIWNVDKLIGAYTLRLKEQDEKQRKTLVFLQSIWFDVINKWVTDTIIHEINTGGNLKEKFGFTDSIDIENGELGTNKDGDLSKMNFLEQRMFVEFVNMMISGHKDIPNYMNSGGKIQFYKSVADKEAKKPAEFIDKRAYINSRIGISPESTIRQNLGLIGEKQDPNMIYGANYTPDSQGASNLNTSGAEELDKENTFTF